MERMSDKLFSATSVYTTLVLEPNWREMGDEREILDFFGHFGITFSPKEAKTFFEDCHSNLASYLITRAQERYDYAFKLEQKAKNLDILVVSLWGFLGVDIGGTIGFMLLFLSAIRIIAIEMFREKLDDRDNFVITMFRAGAVHCLFPSSNEAFRCQSFILISDIWDDTFFPEFPEVRAHWQKKLGLAV